ncbi:ExbD/TolR family protein [Belliella marina]|uniref:ExbD/TolR family protein n=1 Tax=Belliella marina TaxID=1644146 RepID=A0ABW4VSF7_9BACT
MKKFVVFLLCMMALNSLYSQQVPDVFQERDEFCDEKLSEKEVYQMRTEFEELEAYFIRKGLLKDRTGKSYREVYEQIVLDNDLHFNIDRDFQILDALDFEIYSKCYYKALDPEGFGKLTDRHLHAAEVIVQNNNDEITPGLVAQRILDNLLDEDFDLEFYKISSLIAFYTICQTGSIIDFVEANQSLADFSEIMEVFLDNTNRITIDGSYVSFDQLKEKAHQFLQINPNEKGIVLIASKEVSYEVYLQVKDILSLVYSELNVEDGGVSKNIIYKFSGL